MRRIVCFMLVGACGSTSPAKPDASAAMPDAAPDCIADGGAACFQLPTAPLAVRGGTPALDCTPASLTHSTTAIAMSGVTTDFSSTAALAGTTVDAFYASDLATVNATTTSDAMGAFALSLPAPAPSIIYLRARHANEYDMVFYALGLDVSGAPITNVNLQMLSVAVNAQLETTLQIADPPGSTYQVVFANDCNGAGLVNAIGTMSSTSSVGNAAPTFVPDSRVFYLENTIPQARTDVTATAGNGFSVYGGTPGETYYVQTWGFLDAAGVAQGQAGLRLVSELAVPSIAQTVVVSTVAANQSPQ